MLILQSYFCKYIYIQLPPSWPIANTVCPFPLSSWIWTLGLDRPGVCQPASRLPCAKLRDRCTQCVSYWPMYTPCQYESYSILFYSGKCIPRVPTTCSFRLWSCPPDSSVSNRPPKRGLASCSSILSDRSCGIDIVGRNHSFFSRTYTFSTVSSTVRNNYRF